MKKKGQYVSMFSILIVLSFFFKYALWLLIFSVIGVIVYLFYKKVSDYQENSDKPLNQDSDLDKASTTKALNYTPLTKAEIDAKYDEAKPNVYHSSNTKTTTSIPSQNINPSIPQHKAEFCNTPTQIKTQKENIQTSNTTVEQAVKKPVPVTNTMIINKDTPKKIITPVPKIHKIEIGEVFIKKVFLDDKTIDCLKSRYIAFDVETTGLSAYSDRIIEVGAVLFENGQPTKEFGSLVNAEIAVPYSATSVNHITTDMVRAAPSETIVYTQLTDFLGDALDGTTIICAHNARFDMTFLSETLERLGYDATLSYVDTLSISRSMIHDLDNYKQPTIANYFKIENEQAHRAASDAKVCGSILSNLLSIKLKEQEQIRQAREQQEQEERIKKEAFIKLQKECHEKRESISINPINERIPLNEIRNLNDDEKGYTEGYSFYCNGEVFRKANNFESALKEYDMARYNGYCYPAMYRSYAMIFHKLKDYENEIDILDEAIQRFQDNMQVCEQFEIRRNKAVIIFIEQQEKARIKAEKQNKLEERRKIQTSKSQLGRPILQLSDDMTVIKEFNSVSEAARSIGVSEKVIRETAKGRQKHAGGFVWKYTDEIESNSLEKKI